MRFTISSSCWAATTSLACAGAAAPSSCTWQGPDTRLPRAASRWRGRICCACSSGSGRGRQWRCRHHKKKRPKLSLRALGARTGEVACSKSGEVRWSADRAANLSVVVSALAVIDEVEALALLVGAWSQAHQRLHDVKRMADPTPDHTNVRATVLRDDLRHHVVVANLADQPNRRNKT